MKRTVIVAAAAMLLAMGQSSGDAARLLKAARNAEVVDHDLRAAIKQYQAIVDKYEKTDRPAAATALLAMAECYQKLGDAQAQKVYERLVRDFSAQPEAAAAREKLNAMRAGPSAAAGSARLLCEDCGDIYGSISDDGRIMATVLPFDVADIGIRDLATGAVRPLHIEGASPLQRSAVLTPVLSPDTRQIAYLWFSENGPPGQLRIVPNEARAKSRVIVNNPEFDSVWPIAWSPDGASVFVLASRPDKTWEMTRVSVASGAMTRLQSLNWRMTSPLRAASLSPDGRYLAYHALTTNPPAPPKPKAADLPMEHQIYVMAVDGSGVTAMTTGAGAKLAPAWTSDGRHLLYLSEVSGGWNLWAVPVADGRAAGASRLLKAKLGDVLSLGVTRSGTYYFGEERKGVLSTTIVRIAQAGDRARVDGFVGERPAWSPDGKMVAVQRPRPPGVDIVVRTLATGEERVYTRAGTANGPFLWFGDSKGLLALVREQTQEFWYRVDVHSGQFVKLAINRGDPNILTHAAIKTLSSDGKTLYFGTVIPEGPGGGVIDRIVALDLADGAHREIFRLPIDKARLPRAGLTGRDNMGEMAIAIGPDGLTLAMLLFDRGAKVARLATVRVDGTGYREIAQPFEARNVRNKLAWSADGKWIYVATAVGSEDADKHRVMRVPSAGGALQPVGLDVDGLEAFTLNPDGTQLAYSTLKREGGGQFLWALDVAAMLKTSR